MLCMVRMLRMMTLFGLLVFACSCAMETHGPLGSSDAITLKDLGGAEHRPMQVGQKGPAVLFFVLHDCPICNEYAPEINRIVADYRNKGVSAYLVHVDKDVSIDELKKHAKEY